MRIKEKITGSRFEDLMDRQQVLCEIYKRRLWTDETVAAVDIDTARRLYMQQLRQNTHEIILRNDGDPTTTFHETALFLSERMNEIFNVLTWGSESELESAEVLAACCESDYRSYLGLTPNAEHKDTYVGVTIVVNDAADIAIPVTLRRAMTEVARLTSPPTAFDPAV